MKATLTFKLPEEREQYEMHVNAGRLYNAVYDYAAWLRNVCKHENSSKHTAEDCREKLYEFMKENEFNF